jgi:hypothetical protein
MLQGDGEAWKVMHLILLNKANTIVSINNPLWSRYHGL